MRVITRKIQKTSGYAITRPYLRTRFGHFLVESCPGCRIGVFRDHKKVHDASTQLEKFLPGLALRRLMRETR